MRRQREQPATGIYRDRQGWRAFVQVDGQLLTKRFPATATLTEMKEWREDTRVHARSGALPKKPRAGSTTGFAADADRYLKAVKAMTTYAEREHHLEFWIKTFGDRPRTTIEPAEIAAGLQQLRNQDLAASTVNHYRSALMNLWTVLDGRGAPNPVRSTRKFEEPRQAPRALTPAAVKAALSKMRDSPTRARIAVLAWTGMSPATLRLIEPADFDRKGKTIRVPGRQKGAGATGRLLPLAQRAVAAFVAMNRWKAWGACNTGVLRRAWQRAAKKVGLDGVTLLHLRHTFGTEVYKRSGDIRAAQVLLGHADARMTERYTLAAVDPRLAEAVRRLNR